MGRGWKIALGVVVVLVSLLAINTLLVDGDTDSAEVTVPKGRIVDLPGGEVQISVGGPIDTSPIALIHCFSCALDYWDGMRPALEREHRVVAIDLLGHGGSEKPASGYSIPEQASLVAGVLHDLAMENATVVGHSLGGAVSVALAENYPRLVGRVAIIDMPPDDTYGDLGFLASLAFVPVLGEALWTIKPDFSVRQGLEVAFAPGFDIPDSFVDDVNRLTYTAYDETPAQTEDFISERSLDQRMRATRIPLMVMMGAEEQVVNDPRRALAQYAGAVPGAETHLIAGAGHSPNVEKPALSAALVLKFAK